MTTTTISLAVVDPLMVNTCTPNAFISFQGSLTCCARTAPQLPPPPTSGHSLGHRSPSRSLPLSRSFLNAGSSVPQRRSQMTVAPKFPKTIEWW